MGYNWDIYSALWLGFLFCLQRSLPHLYNKCTKLAKPFCWLRNSEAILYAVTLPNCGLVELFSCVAKVQKFAVATQGSLFARSTQTAVAMSMSTKLRRGLNHYVVYR